MEEIRQLVSKLYLHLNVEQFESEREEKILKKLELIKSELEPMEKVIIQFYFSSNCILILILIFIRKDQTTVNVKS